MTGFKSEHTISRIVHKKSYGDGVSASFRVRSEKLVAALAARGMAKKKPDRVPNREIEDSPDFWRGAVDADGTVRMAEDKNGYEYASIMLCGHIPMLEKFQKFLEHRGITSTITDTTSGIFQVRLMGTGAVKVIRVLYENAEVALDRKLATAREILNEQQQ